MVSVDKSNNISTYCQKNETSTHAEARKENEEQLDEIATAYLFEEEHEKSYNVLINDLCECFVELCQYANERACITVLKVFEARFFVLKYSILKYRSIEAMREKLREEAEKNVFVSL